MVNILKAYSIPPNLLIVIEAMYTDTRTVFVTPDGEIEGFGNMAGVLQGDSLAPNLFIIALDYALQKATEGKEKNRLYHHTKKIKKNC